MKHIVSSKTTLHGAMACLLSLGLAAPMGASAGGGDVSAADWAVTLESARNYTDQIIVKLKGGFSLDRLGELRVAAGIDLDHFRPMSGGADVFRLPTRMHVADIAPVVQRLRASGLVDYAQADRTILPLAMPTDPSYSKQWHYMGPADGEPGGANLPGAWDVTTGHSSVVVTVIDTGATTHEDVSSSRAAAGYDFISKKGAARDGDKRDDDPTDEGDWCFAIPSSWHGTHVAGTVGAATNNGVGASGVTWNGKIQHARFLGKCGGTTSDMVDAIRWAAGLSVPDVPGNATPAKVLNLSVGGAGSCGNAEQSAIDDAIGAGASVVVAAGNENKNVSGSTSANCDGVIAVAANNRAGGRASYSNYGSGITIAAPGGDSPSNPDGVYSTVKKGRKRASGDKYAYYVGTSMATPHVSGVIALMQAAHLGATGGYLSPAEVESILTSTARSFPGGTGSNCTTSLCGAGLLDAEAAVSAAATP